ncbi:DUF6538 domain-containing protein, partial [Pseudomonas syringae]|uniref:DUF6538 domain-containing protein n=1 Tax=Pseudomonas syringae TaxID=317 RepID=UPI00190F92FD
MTQRDNLYRRSSGIYVLRITVPARYRAQVRQQEIHVSTKTTNIKAAKAVASHLLVQWHLCMRELDQVNEAKVIQGSPLLAGPGAISIQVFCDTFDVEAELVFQEILNNNIDIACLLRAQRIHLVDDYTKVDRETDTGGFVLDSALELGREQVFTGYLQPFHRGHTIANMIEHRYSLETVFRSKRKTLNAAFCDLPGIQISASTIFITKIQAERIRAPWVKTLIANSAQSAQASAQILIPTLTPIQPPAPTLLPTVSPPTAVGISPVTAVPLVFEARFCNPKYSEMRSSNLLEKFFEYKAPQWKPGHHERVATICGSFIDLMGDPLLGVIDRDLIRFCTKSIAV